MRRLVIVVLMCVFAVGSIALQSTAAVAQPDPPPPSLVPPQEPPSIIPKPNTGVAPTDAGDRGGALQIGVFVLIVGGIGLIIANIVRQSRAARRARSGT